MSASISMAWGHKTSPLTRSEREALRKTLKCTFAVEPVVPGSKDGETWEVVRGFDGSYVGPTSSQENRGFLRWLLQYSIVPEAPSWSKGHSAAVGQAHDAHGGWVGWSHRGAQRHSTRKDAENFAREVS